MRERGRGGERRGMRGGRGRGRDRIFSLCLSQIIVVMLQVNPPEGKRLVTDWKTIVLIVEPGKRLLHTNVPVIHVCSRMLVVVKPLL